MATGIVKCVKGAGYGFIAPDESDKDEWHLNFPKCLPRNWYGQKWPRLP
jgi:hypothetical protein